MRKRLALILVILSIQLFSNPNLPAAEVSKSRAAPPEERSRAEPKKAPRILDLYTAQRLALAGNPSIAAARERIRYARWQLEEVRTRYFPTVDASASTARVHTAANQLQGQAGLTGGLDVEAAPDSTQGIYSTSVKASWILFDGFDRRFAAIGAKWDLAGSREADRDSRRTLLQAVADAYYNAQLAQENVIIAQADIDFFLRQVEEARLRLEAGTGSLSDVLTFQVQVNAARFDRIAALRDYEAAMIVLAALVGITDARFAPEVRLAPLGPEKEAELKVPEAPPLIQYAVDNRPDLYQSRYNAESARASIGRAKAGYYPAVTVSGSVDGERPDDPGFEGDDFGNNVALTLSYNIFSGGLTRARVGSAKARTAELEKQFENLKISVASDVRQALQSLESAVVQLALQRQNENLARRTLDLVQKEYQAGQASLVRLREAQRDFVLASSRLALARVDLRRAWQALYATTGRILEFFEAAPALETLPSDWALKD